MQGDRDGEPQTAGDIARRLAAFYADTADEYEGHARALREAMSSNAASLATNAAEPIFVQSPVSPAQMVQMLESASYKARTSQHICGEQARAYDAFIEAGGDTNPMAKAQWDEVWERTKALMPDWNDEGVGT